MSPEMFCCCKEQSSWIFVYTNEEVYGICPTHFNSPAHRISVKHVINIRNHEIYNPQEIFAVAKKLEAA